MPAFPGSSYLAEYIPQESSAFSGTVLGWWKCDETGGTTLADSSGNGRTITLNSSYSVNATGISSNSAGSNKAVDLTSGYGERSGDSTLQNLTTGWTIGAWVNIDTFVDSNLVIGMGYDGSNVNFGLIHNRDGAHGTGKFSVGFYNGAWHEAVYGTALSTGVTYFLAGTFDGTTLRFYLNGALVSSDTPGSSPSATSGSSLYLGHKWEPSDTNYQDGRTDDAFVIDGVLSGDQIASLYSDMNYLASLVTSPDATVTPDAVVSVGGAPAASVSVGSTIDAVQVAGSGSVPSVAAGAGSAVSPSPAAAVGDVPAPASVTGNSSVDIAASAVAASSSVPRPDLQIGAVTVAAVAAVPVAVIPIPADLVAGSAGVPAPDLSTGVSLSPGVVAATSFIANPMSNQDAYIDVHIGTYPPIVDAHFESTSDDAGFTLSSLGWSDPVISTDEAHSGSSSIFFERIASGATDGFCLSFDVLTETQPYTYYEVTFWMKASTNNQYDLALTYGLTDTMYTSIGAVGVPGSWVRVSAVIYSSFYNNFGLMFHDRYAESATVGDQVYFDDLTVAELLPYTIGRASVPAPHITADNVDIRPDAVQASAAVLGGSPIRYVFADPVPAGPSTVPVVHITADNAVVLADPVDSSASVPAPGLPVTIVPGLVAATASIPAAVADVPPGPITDLVLSTVDPFTIQIDWVNPSDTDFDSVTIMRFEGLPVPGPTTNPINDVVLLSWREPASPGDPQTYFDYTAVPGRTYYYVLYTYDTSDLVNVDDPVYDSISTEPLTDVDAVVFGFQMLAGTVELQPGTPIPAPPSGTDIVINGQTITIELAPMTGVYWNKTLSTPPPTRPNDPPPNYTGPGSGPAFQWDFNDPLIPPRTPTDIRVEIWDQTNTQLIQSLDYSASRQFLDEYNGVGSGSLRVPKPHIDAALLQRDRVIRFYYRDIPDAVFASVIQGRSTQVIGTPGDEWVSVNGPGILSWLEDAVVLPFKQKGDRYPKKSLIKADGTLDSTQDSELQINSPDVRAFNFASRDFFRPQHRYRLFDAVGPGTNAVLEPGYHQPLGYPQSRTFDDGNFRAGFPANWPDPQAEWIWGSNPLAYHPGISDDQKCWFVAHVYLVITGRYRWFCSADDGFILWIDGVEMAAHSYNEDYEEGWRKTTEIDLNLTSGWHVIAMRGENRPRSIPPVIDEYGNPVIQPRLPDANVGAVIGTLMHLDENGKPVLPVPNARTQRVSQTAFTGWLANWFPPAWSAGDVLYTLVEEAQARGITRLQNVTMDFDRDLDSNGAPWTTRVSRTWDVGTSVLQVAFDLCELGVDVWMTPDNVLHCAERRGSDAPSFSILYGQNVLGYATEETFSGASVAYTKTRTGWMMLENETAVAVLGGRRETAISVTNTDSEDAAIGISKRAIGAVVMANIVATADAIIPRDADPSAVPAVQGSIPYTDVGISDIIYVLSPNGQRRMGRLLSVSVTEDDAGTSSWVPEIEIWSSPFGDGVDPSRPLDPVDPNNPFDSSTWVPAVEDWTRFVPVNAGSVGAGDYPRRVTLPPPPGAAGKAENAKTAYTAGSNEGGGGGGGGDYGSDPVSYAGNTPVPRNSSYSTPVDPDYYDHAAKPNYERIFIGPEAPLITAGYHLWVDTSGLAE